MARLITLLVFDQFGFLDVVGPADVFTIANQRAGKELYRLQTAAVSRQRSVVAESGMRLLVDVDARRVEKTHTLLVTGGDGFRAATESRQLIAEVQRLARISQRVVLYLNRSGGQSQFSECLHPQPAPVDRFAQLLADISADASSNLSRKKPDLDP